MKKTIIIIVVIIVLGGAGYYELLSRQNAEYTNPAPVTTKANGDTAVKESLFDQLKSGRQLDCLVTTTAGEDIIILAKDGMVRLDSTPDLYGPSPDGRDWITVQSSDWIYVWDGNTGMKVNAPTLAAAIQGGNTDAEKFSWESLVQKWQVENAKYQCQDSKLGDSLFMPPENITFTDLTDKLPDLSQVMANLPSAPSGQFGSASTSQSVESGGVKTEYENIDKTE
jgi:hypothetical protein